MDCPVKTTRDKDQIRAEFYGYREQKRFACEHVFVTAEISLFIGVSVVLICNFTCLPGHIYIIADSFSSSDVRRGTVLSLWKEGHAVVAM